MGFGHRVYKNYDPRAKIIKRACDDVFAVTGVNPLLKIAVELEKIALEDDYFVSRRLYPNVDFYSGLIYEALHSRRRCSRCCSRSPGHRDGCPSGWSLSQTPTRRSRAPSRSIPANAVLISSNASSAGPDRALRYLSPCPAAQRCRTTRPSSQTGSSDS